jgi:cytochrome c55X
MKPLALIVAPLLLAGLSAPPGAAAAPQGDGPAPGTERQRELLHMVRQDCGSCHGLRLTGGLGPALTPQALADKPLESMAATIYGGRPGTPMPPWKRFLSADEAAWIARQLAQGLPAERGLVP